MARADAYDSDMVAFDTLKASRRLRDAGFEEKQANALVYAFAEDIGANLATKDDIALLKGDIALLRKDMDSGFESLRKDMTAEIRSLRKDMTSENAALRQDMTGQIESLRKDMTSGNAALRQDMELLEQRLKLRMALAVGGAATMILTALGIIAGIIVSRL